VYVTKNLSIEGRALCKTTIGVIARLCETVIFVLMGYGFWLYTVGGSPPAALSPNVSAGGRHAATSTSTTVVGTSIGTGLTSTLIDPCVPLDAVDRIPIEPSFIGLTLAMCILSRGCSVFPLAALANLCRKREKRIRIHEQAVIWFSGLRGAIALALAVEFPTAIDVEGTPGVGNFCNQREHIVACTIVVVMCTVFVLGGFTRPVLSLCGIEMRTAERPSSTSPMRVQTPSTAWWKRALLAADRSVLRPVLVALDDARPSTELADQMQYVPSPRADEPISNDRM